ncbi:hypothetical protein DsansV1_C31g0218041 [Dioscorea sansibarensis]
MGILLHLLYYHLKEQQQQQLGTLSMVVEMVHTNHKFISFCSYLCSSFNMNSCRQIRESETGVFQIIEKVFKQGIIKQNNQSGIKDLVGKPRSWYSNKWLSLFKYNPEPFRKVELASLR